MTSTCIDLKFHVSQLRTSIQSARGRQRGCRGCAAETYRRNFGVSLRKVGVSLRHSLIALVCMNGGVATNVVGAATERAAGPLN